ncbi:hypothetical protein GCM10027589_43830 [Actinocorallia lasiicapitis]
MRHRTDPGALAAGLYFLAVAGYFAATGFGGDEILAPVTLGPVLAIGFSVVLLVRIASRSRRRDPAPEDEPAQM